MEKIRLQKLLADCGYCSRRKAEELIRQGRVQVGGRPVKLGDKVSARDYVTVDGQHIVVPKKKNYRYIMMNKPRGYVTTLSDEQGRRCVTDLLEGIPERVYPVGRLDKNSEGLLLFTNDGNFANGIMHPSREITKTYRVTVRPPVSEEQLAEMDEDDRDNLQSVQVMTNVDGIQYQLDFTIRDDEQYKLSSFYMYPGSPMSPKGIDDMFYDSKFLRTEVPTQEQIDAAVKKAGELLNGLGLGQWQVDGCEVWVPDLRGVEEYTIIVKALPVFNGVAAIRQPALDSIKSDDIYAHNCYMTEAKIEYNAEGKLVGFEMQTPMDVVEVLNDNVATMTMDDLVQRTKDQLSLTDKEAFGLSGQYLDLMERGAGEEIICKVDLCQIEYGMVRIRVPNTEDSYYYVPALKCSGTIDYVGAESGEVYSASGTDILGERILPILVLNAVDGSVIEQGIG